jgi:hypothetical protein
MRHASIPAVELCLPTLRRERLDLETPEEGTPVCDAKEKVTSASQCAAPSSGDGRVHGHRHLSQGLRPISRCHLPGGLDQFGRSTPLPLRTVLIFFNPLLASSVYTKIG